MKHNTIIQWAAAIATIATGTEALFPMGVGAGVAVGWIVRKSSVCVEGRKR